MNISKESWNWSDYIGQSWLQSKYYQGYRVFILIEESVCKEDIQLCCAPHHRASKFMKRKLMEPQEEIDKSAFIVRDYNTMSWMDLEAHVRPIKFQLWDQKSEMDRERGWKSTRKFWSKGEDVAQIRAVEEVTRQRTNHPYPFLVVMMTLVSRSLWGQGAPGGCCYSRNKLCCATVRKFAPMPYGFHSSAQRGKLFSFTTLKYNCHIINCLYLNFYMPVKLPPQSW